MAFFPLFNGSAYPSMFHNDTVVKKKKGLSMQALYHIKKSGFSRHCTALITLSMLQI